MELVLTAEHAHGSHIRPATEARSALLDAQEREERFWALLLPAKHSLSRFIAALERNDDDARGCMSETIAVAWHAFDALTSNEAFLSWIMTIARRLVYRKERREKFRGWLRQPRRFFARYDDDNYAEDDFSLLPDNENSAYSPDTATDIQILYAMLTRLSFKQREAVILSEIVGYSLQEIAEM